jgi:hypothetical protein
MIFIHMVFFKKESQTNDPLSVFKIQEALWKGLKGNLDLKIEVPKVNPHSQDSQVADPKSDIMDERVKTKLIVKYKMGKWGRCLWV